MPSKNELVMAEYAARQENAQLRQRIAELEQLAQDNRDKDAVIMSQEGTIARLLGELEQARTALAEAKAEAKAEELSFLLNKHLVIVQYDNGYRIKAVPQAAIVDRAAELRKQAAPHIPTDEVDLLPMIDSPPYSKPSVKVLAYTLHNQPMICWGSAEAQRMNHADGSIEWRWLKGWLPLPKIKGVTK
jgi:hypothetical protein